MLRDIFYLCLEAQRQLWNDVGSVSIANGLDQIVDFIQFINTMKTQKRTHGFTRKLEEKYKKMLLSPYFGRIDFLENGDKKSEKYYMRFPILFMKYSFNFA